jgi:hypothetical protein
LTPRGHHTLGSTNHLAIFATDYLELLGFGDGSAVRSELTRFPEGLNGLVFKAADADAVHEAAAAAGLPVLPVQRFSRPVEAAGTRHDATFRTTRLDPMKIAIGRVYFCEHQTPELVWRPEWQSHPNGAQAIAKIVVASPEPRRDAGLFAAMFGPAAVTNGDGKCVIRAGAARVELLPPAAVVAEFGDAAAAPAGRAAYLAALELRVPALAAAADRLRAVPGLRVEPRRVVVPAAAACNTTLLFAEA